MKSWLAQGSSGRRVTLLPGTTFLHNKTGLRTRQFAMYWLRVDPGSYNEAISYFVATRLRVATRQN